MQIQTRQIHITNAFCCLKKCENLSKVLYVLWVDPEVCPVSNSLFSPLCLNDFIIAAIVTYAVTGVNSGSVFCGYRRT